MTILHICTSSNYNVISSYIKFIYEEYYSKSNHTFIIMDKICNVPDNIKQYDNVIIVDENSAKNIIYIIKEMKSHDRIILHSLNKTYFQFILLLNKKLFKKLFWVSWGADLYQWKVMKNSIKYKIRNLIAYDVRMKIRNFVGIFPPDIDYFKKEFNSDAKTFYASYVGGLYNNLYKKQYKLRTLAEKTLNNEYINIQIGHSSTSILNHIDVLENLVKYKNENIKIYIPLSYGNKKYGDRVQEVATQLFKDKVVCIREMMDKDDYMKFLSAIDIAIFNTTRQIGLGNITPLLYMEKKIYIPKGTVMYDFYKDQEINICDYRDINKMNYDSFIEPVNMNNAKEYVILNSLNKEKKVEMWNNVFNAPLK